ncbi:MAG TPA: M13 family metallopeptidase [Thermoanaerobaculia bacterium]
MKQTLALLAILLLAACATTAPQTPAAQPATATASAAAATPATPRPFDRANLDPATNACTDFYQYANGGWLKANPIPPQYTAYGPLTIVNEDMRKVMREILEEAANKPAAQRTPAEQKIGDFYSSCMNESAIDAAGLTPLQPELDRINAIRTPADVQAAFIRLQSLGVSVPFLFHSTQDAKNSSETIAELYQAGLGLPDRDYYFRDDEKSRRVREDYAAHMGLMFELAGVTTDDVASVLRIEQALAAASMTAVQLRDPQAQYNRMSIADLSKLAPQIDWNAYLAARGVNAATVNVAQPNFIKEVSRLVTAMSVDDWKPYLRWQLLYRNANVLPSAIENENFHFRNKVLLGQQKPIDRWQRCVQRVNSQIGEVLGQVYVERKFPPAAKRKALEMVENLTVALREDLKSLDWMSAETKKNAIAKLASFRRKIGYPDKWRDYSALQVSTGPLAANQLATQQFAVERDLAKIGKPLDRDEWLMTPPTINAYYNPPLAEIVFPAGILQWPMFDINQDDAFNYGAIGSVIGHELTHGFDDEGSQYDASGNLRNWWTAEDKKRFEERAECIVRQFDAYEIEPGTAHQGKLVAGESIADLGGAIIAFEAWQKSRKGKPAETVDGFTPEQLFFLGFARARAQNQTIEAQRNKVLTDPHPVNKFRVNGPLSNMPEFASAFGCKAGDPMVRKDLCEIW